MSRYSRARARALARYLAIFFTFMWLNLNVRSLNCWHYHSISFHCISKNRRNNTRRLECCYKIYVCSNKKNMNQIYGDARVKVASLDALRFCRNVYLSSVSLDFSFAYGNVTNKLNVEICNTTLPFQIGSFTHTHSHKRT